MNADGTFDLAAWLARPDKGPWYRCEQPERPTDPMVRWHYDDCPGCRFGAQLLLRQLPDDPHVQSLASRLGVVP